MSKVFYVNNLNSNADLSELESAFTTVGDIESHEFQVDPESQRGFGIFQMKTEQQAADCIERFNGQALVNERLSVTLHRPKPKQRKLR